jgi:hypothetical protein
MSDIHPRDIMHRALTFNGRSIWLFPTPAQVNEVGQWHALVRFWKAPPSLTRPARNCIRMIHIEVGYVRIIRLTSGFTASYKNLSYDVAVRRYPIMLLVFNPMHGQRCKVCDDILYH